MEKFSTISVTSTYAGDALKKYILSALVGGETMSTQGISILTNVKFKRNLKKMAAAGVVQKGGCAFTPTSGVTVTEAVLEPKEIKVNEQICFEDIYNTWDSADMAAGINNENLAAELVNAISDTYVGQTTKEVEEAIWQGDATGNTSTIKDEFDGFEKILNAGAIVTGFTATTLTVANIVSQINAVYAQLPAGVLKKGKAALVIFISHKGASLYEMALATQGLNTTSANGLFSSIYGIEIKPVGGFSTDDQIVMGERANFYLGTDLEADFNQLKTIDMRETTGDEAVRFILKAKLDVAVALPGEVVFYQA